MTCPTCNRPLYPFIDKMLVCDNCGAMRINGTVTHQPVLVPTSLPRCPEAFGTPNCMKGYRRNPHVNAKARALRKENDDVPQETPLTANGRFVSRSRWANKGRSTN